MSEHTPTPWAVEEVRTSIGRCFKIGSPEMLNEASKKPTYLCVYDDYGTGDNIQKANAAFIVKAVNSHDALLCVVRQLIEAVDSGNLQMSSPEIGEPENNIPIHQWHEELLHYARAALASLKERA